MTVFFRKKIVSKHPQKTTLVKTQSSNVLLLKACVYSFFASLRFGEKYIDVYGQTLVRCFLTALLIGLISNQQAAAAEYESMITWHRKARLSTPVSGVVARVLVQVGQVVKLGESLMILDDKVYQAEVNKNKAKLNYIRKLFKEAKRELERNIELHEQTVLSDHELELASISHADAKAAYNAAGAAVIESEYNLKYSVIRAPFDGVIVKRNVEIGEIIINQQYAEILFEIADANKMVAQLSISEDKIKTFSLGQSAKIIIGQKRYIGKIQYLGMEPIAGKSRVYPVRVVFETNGINFRDGQSAKVVLP